MMRHSFVLAAAYVGSAKAFITPSATVKRPILNLRSTSPDFNGANQCVVEENGGMVPEPLVDIVESYDFLVTEQFTESEISDAALAVTKTGRTTEVFHTDKIIPDELLEKDMILNISNKTRYLIS